MEKFDDYIKGYDEENKPFDVIELKKQHKNILSISQIKPKGDIDMKNITYRPKEKRYIGRKQIRNQKIIVYAKTQLQCAEKLKAEIKKALKINVEKKDNTKFLFKDLYLKWFHEEKERFTSQSTQAKILTSLDRLKPFHSNNVKAITKQMLTDFFIKMPDNRTKELTRLYANAFFKYLLDEGTIKVNPCANVRVLKSNAHKKAFTYEQQVAILNKLKGTPLDVIIKIYLITGLRKTEFNFKSIEQNIDFDNRILKALNLKGRNFVVRYKEIKLSQEALNLIKNNLNIIHKYCATTAYRDFAKVLKELGIKGSIVNCRHTFATNCFYLGKPELVISREMGHSKSQITKDIYTDIDYHLSAEKINKLYNNLYNIEN